MTRIEYVLNPDGSPGENWNLYTGCLHGLDICTTSETCWARGMSHRFEATCGGDFQPRFHVERHEAPFHWRKPRRVAVSFMGDLFGNWPSAEDAFTEQDVPMKTIRLYILRQVRTYPQHTFLFLTKRPEALAEFNPWPSNAWVGCSITGAETPERQVAMLKALGQVQGAGMRWLSYEPALGPLPVLIPNWIDWVICGAQSGRDAKPFEPSWTNRIWQWASGQDPHYGSSISRPIWEKNNLARYLKRPLVQKLP